jgi:hypothetical protein
MKTYIRIHKGEDRNAVQSETVSRYLPDNYEVVGEDRKYLYVEGEDYAGWTADGYVIPRLHSGLISAEKINQATFVAGTRPGE